MPKKYYYHLVENKAVLKSVLKNGLVPKIGKNSIASCETVPRIYTAPYSSVPFWKNFLKKKYAVRVDTSKISEKPEIREKGEYVEVMFRDPIPPEALKRVFIPGPILGQKKLVWKGNA